MEDSQLRANAAVDELSMLILAQAAELFDAPQIKRMNRALNALRVCVENGFSKLTQLWKFMRAPEKCRLLDSSVG